MLAILQDLHLTSRDSWALVLPASKQLLAVPVALREAENAQVVCCPSAAALPIVGNTFF